MYTEPVQRYKSQKINIKIQIYKLFSRICLQMISFLDLEIAKSFLSQSNRYSNSAGYILKIVVQLVFPSF